MISQWKGKIGHNLEKVLYIIGLNTILLKQNALNIIDAENHESNIEIKYILIFWDVDKLENGWRMCPFSEYVFISVRGHLQIIAYFAFSLVNQYIVSSVIG